MDENIRKTSYAKYKIADKEYFVKLDFLSEGKVRASYLDNFIEVIDENIIHFHKISLISKEEYEVARILMS